MLEMGIGSMDNRLRRNRLTIRLRSDWLLPLLPALFYVANLLRMLSITSVLYDVILVGAGIIGFLAAILTKNKLGGRVWLYLALYLVTMVINMMVIGNVRMASLETSVLLLGIALLMLLRQWSFSMGVLVFYPSAALILYRLSISSSRRILISSSNYISVVILLAVAFYYIAIDLENRKIRIVDLIPAVICFYISVAAEGRGGILCSILLLVSLLVIYMQNLTSKSARRRVLLVILLLFLAVFLYLRNISLVDSFLKLGKFRDRGTDNSARMKIWRSYFFMAKESLAYILAGAPLKDIGLINAYGGNTHNSFIQLHAFNGIITLIVTLILVVEAVLIYLREKQYVIAAMFITLCVRGLTDKFIFGQYAMPLFLFLMLYAYKGKRRNHGHPVRIR